MTRTTQELTAEANAAGVGFKADKDKARWDLVPWTELRDIVDVLTVGARKYAPGNWKKVPDARERYFAAAMRHLTAWRTGELYDPETGLAHLAQAGCSLLFLAWFDGQDEEDPEPTQRELSELEHLRAQRDELHERNTELVEERRAVSETLSKLVEAQLDAAVVTEGDQAGLHGLSAVVSGSEV